MRSLIVVFGSLVALIACADQNGTAGVPSAGAAGAAGGLSGAGGGASGAGGGGSGANGMAGVGGAGAAGDGDSDAGLDAEVDVDDSGVDDTLYSVSAPLEISITLAESDWDLLRKQGRSMPHVMAGCPQPSFTEYTQVPAQVRVGDELLAEARVRKKGFLGSLSVYRPSLRFDVGRGETSTFHGQKHITLNNNRQDPSNARQCVAYALFEKAGLAAPRCGLAHVTVNGADKGIYSSVEPIEEAFLQRVFGDDSGNLYEVTVPADFTPELVELFELKTNESSGDRSDLDRVVSALGAPDAELMDELREVFDLDEFITFWAMEALIAHVDGLSRNNNNTFLYHDPRDDRFHPILWGADQVLTVSEDQPDEPRSPRHRAGDHRIRLYDVSGAIGRALRDRLYVGQFPERLQADGGPRHGSADRERQRKPRASPLGPAGCAARQWLRTDGHRRQRRDQPAQRVRRLDHAARELSNGRGRVSWLRDVRRGRRRSE
jgi:hypothetical protein